MTAIRIPAANGGNDYALSRNGAHYVLSRSGKTGRPNHISLTRADAINIANQLIDIIEQDQDNNHD